MDVTEILPTHSAVPAPAPLLAPMDRDVARRLYDEALALVIRTRNVMARHVDTPDEDLTPDHLRGIPVQMRMTAQLLDALGWIMMQRAAAVGEITIRQALEPKMRLNADLEKGGLEGSEMLVPDIRALAQEADRLWHRFRRLEANLLAQLQAQN
jgi:hypothetical protein